MSILIVWIPLGIKLYIFITLSLNSEVNTLSILVSEISITRPGSDVLNSRLNTFSISDIWFLTSSTALLLTTIIHSDSRGIALFFEPPLTLAKSKSTFSKFNNLPNSLLELALCLIISIPEWPPSKPFISTNKAALSSDTSLYSTGKVDIAVAPPAQLTNI